MVRPPKNIQWWWSPQKPLKICNGLFTFLDPRYVDLYALEEDVLQRIVEDISRCYLIFHSSLKYLDMILSSFGDMILTRDSIINLKTIVDHCPQNFENHRKTIGSNGWTPKKTFNGDGPTLSKPLKNHWRQWWPKKKTLTIPSPWKIDHRCGLDGILYTYNILNNINNSYCMQHYGTRACWPFKNLRFKVLLDGILYTYDIMIYINNVYYMPIRWNKGTLTL